MTHKTTMPEPVAYAIFAENGNIRIWSREPGGLPDADSLGPMHHLITTAQAEDYKDACVRELQAAAKDLADWAEHDVGAWPELTPGLKEIRALIPEDEP